MAHYYNRVYACTHNSFAHFSRNLYLLDQSPTPEDPKAQDACVKNGLFISSLGPTVPIVHDPVIHHLSPNLRICS